MLTLTKQSPNYCMRRSIFLPVYFYGLLADEQRYVKNREASCLVNYRSRQEAAAFFYMPCNYLLPIYAPPRSMSQVSVKKVWRQSTGRRSSASSSSCAGSTREGASSMTSRPLLFLGKAMQSRMLSSPAKRLTQRSSP